MIRPVMNFTQLLRPFSNRSAGRRVKVSRQRRSRHYGSLPSQALEDRILLSAYVVNTTADVVANDGLVSLREAILAANTNAAVGDAIAGSANGDSITFAASVFTPGTSITLTGGQLNITDDLTITATLGNVVVDGNDLTRLFSVNSTETVSFNGLTFESGNAGAGNGGAILKSGSGQLSINNSDFYFGSAVLGGAIYSSGGTTVINNTVISDNTATLSGGGLYLTAGATANITNSTLEENIASGAAAINGGGAIYNAGGTLSVGNSLLSGNAASGAAGSGGAVFVAGGTTTIANSELSDNDASRAGGAIEAATATILNINTSDLLSNSAGAAPGNGGALHITGAGSTVTLNGGTVVGNTASREGGGLWNDAGSTMNVNGVRIANNTALGVAADDGGGGVFNNGGTTNITNGTITGNRATGTAGSGGGLFSLGGTVTVTGTIFTANTAMRAGGAIEVASAGNVTLNNVTQGGATAALGNRAGAAPGNGGALHITGAGSTVTLNGGTVENNVASREGGGLWNDAGSTMNVNGVRIANNTALGAAADDGGGGVFNNGGTTNITNGTITGNKATGAAGSGGGLFSLGGTVTVTGTVFTANTAMRAGGAIEVASAGNVTLNNVTQGGTTAALGNKAGAAPGNGGALHITGAGSTVTLNGGLVQNNVASREGGGLWNDAGSTLNVNDARILNNVAQGVAADDGGGGIFNNGGTTVINQTTIANNSATGRFGAGGGIHSNGGVVTLKNSTVNNNSANAGGGLANLGGEMNVVNATISTNKARTGGGIANYADMDITNATIVLNEGYAGGIYAFTGSDTLMNNSIVGGNKGEQDSDDDIVGWLNANSSFNIVSDSRSAGNLRNNRQGNQIGRGGSGQILIGSIIDTTLKNNGGPTSTHALKRHGDAINAGSNALAVDENGVALTRDQRGSARISGGTVDIGAYEYIDLA